MKRFHPWLIAFLPGRAQVWVVQVFGFLYVVFSLLILIFAIKG